MNLTLQEPLYPPLMVFVVAVARLDGRAGITAVLFLRDVPRARVKRQPATATATATTTIIIIIVIMAAAAAVMAVAAAGTAVAVDAT